VPGITHILEGDKHEEAAKGFSLLSIADRRGDHSDHRGHRNPELIKSKMAANEASAVGSPPYDHHRKSRYSSACPTIGFAATLAEMNTSAVCQGCTNQIDGTSREQDKSGYNFTDPTVVGTPATNFRGERRPGLDFLGNAPFLRERTGVIRTRSRRGAERQQRPPVNLKRGARVSREAFGLPPSSFGAAPSQPRIVKPGRSGQILFLN